MKRPLFVLVLVILLPAGCNHDDQTPVDQCRKSAYDLFAECLNQDNHHPNGRASMLQITACEASRHAHFQDCVCPGCEAVSTDPSALANAPAFGSAAVAAEAETAAPLKADPGRWCLPPVLAASEPSQD